MRKKAGVADVIEIIRGWQQFFGRPDLFPACISKAQEKKDKREKGGASIHPSHHLSLEPVERG